MFAAIYLHEGRIWMNLKAEPLRGDFLKSVFPAVVPAYHMNKTHWISLILDGSVPEADILSMIRESYQLTGA
ncbi:MAG: MmcQ/YjbR family DNA-binding protein [Candidatus Faecivicinus sp.]|nr:MmcQ/YjbR family DNA-binding protein [Candidatus Faecivicinus sp.]